MRALLNLAVAATLLTAAAVAEAGCARCAPIMNITNAAVTTASAVPLAEEQVRSAIVRAGMALGWHMGDVGPGKIAATLALRTHLAEVEISYSSTQYSIVYKNSTNLDAADGQIHRNYNGWIQNLNRGIVTQFSLV